MARNIIIGILVIATLAAGAFAFFQTQNLTELQESSTQSVNNAIATGTQDANNVIATHTRLADEAFATGTNFANSSFETATDSARIANENALATQTELANYASGTEAALIDSANATSTEQVNRVNATGTQVADNANATATEAAHLAATQASIGTDIADNLATQQIELTVAAIVFTDSQATSDAQNVILISTLEAVGISGDGVQGASAILQNNFNLFEGQGYEIALPERFVAGDFAGDDVDALEDALNDADLDAIFDHLATENDDFLFFAIDSTFINGVPRATISLIREEALSEGTSLPAYVNNALFSLQGNFALIISDIIPVNGQATGRIIIDQQLSDAAVRQVLYIFALDNQFYVLTFTTPIIEYANIREDVETIASSLRIRE